jgi:hypothetical protein
MESSEPDGACQRVIVGQVVIAEKRSRTLSDEQRMVPDTVSTRQYCKNHSKQGRLRPRGERLTECAARRAPKGPGGSPIDSERVSRRGT